MLSNDNSSNSTTTDIIKPPPYHRKIPRYLSGNHNGTTKSSTCLCCCCCCSSLLLLIITIIVSIPIHLFFLLHPKFHSYNITNLHVQSFNIKPNDHTLQTKFIITIRAENPNEKIGIAYRKGSQVLLTYHDLNISSGKLQTFYQGYHNVTMISVELEGKKKIDPKIEKQLLENKMKGKIPLGVHVRVPVVLQMLDWKLRQVTVNVDCDLVVGDLSPGKKTVIKSSDYKINVEY
ncbi:Late embryogenesis abundant protein LEA-2 subgroup domain-containing protein [Dioscorea alata]|uniref:Late embryogenesis abundant protein LEA-2 subgroup domain-containing protein n=1 Tax=Dioscorea alata TaxID=55571 RepID=A0ACB7W9C8_DIOAL|nr:Late embryogenesis abundant protein LEA-2 subgroup domain-containing protein [Dioscorea alata]